MRAHTPRHLVFALLVACQGADPEAAPCATDCPVPAATCSGSLLIEFGEDRCMDTGVSCDFAPIDTDCSALGSVCHEGACVEPQQKQPCQQGSDCVSGQCVKDLCPSTQPATGVCVLSFDCVETGCKDGEMCVDLSPDQGDPLMGCVPADVCDEPQPGGEDCTYDWECESGDCLGVSCGGLPTAFAFGNIRVCASGHCLEQSTQIDALADCATTSGCTMDDPPTYPDCVAEACPEAWALCAEEPSCLASIDCIKACPADGFPVCLSRCVTEKKPCADGEVERTTPDGTKCYCVSNAVCQ